MNEGSMEGCVYDGAGGHTLKGKVGRRECWKANKKGIEEVTEGKEGNANEVRGAGKMEGRKEMKAKNNERKY